MMASSYRGESGASLADFRQFDFDLDLCSNEVSLIFSDGTRLEGKIQPDDEGRMTVGEPIGYSVSASGIDSQNLPIEFNCSLLAVKDLVRTPVLHWNPRQVEVRGVDPANLRQVATILAKEE